MRKLRSIERFVQRFLSTRCFAEVNKLTVGFHPAQRAYIENLKYLSTATLLRLLATDADINSYLSSNEEHKKLYNQLLTMESSFLGKSDAEIIEIVDRFSAMLDKKLDQAIAELDDLHTKAVNNGCSNSKAIGPFSICL